MEHADDIQELRDVLARAENGDAEVLPRLRALLAGQPGIWRRYADLGGNLEAELIRLACGDNLLLQESLVRQVGEMKDELAVHAPSRWCGCWRSGRP
jgi:hypothetical protein